MKYRVAITIKGTVIRPSYQGVVEVFSNEINPDFDSLVYERLKRTSFPEISKSDILVRQVLLIVD